MDINIPLPNHDSPCPDCHAGKSNYVFQMIYHLTLGACPRNFLPRVLEKKVIEQLHMPETFMSVLFWGACYEDRNMVQVALWYGVDVSVMILEDISPQGKFTWDLFEGSFECMVDYVLEQAAGVWLEPLLDGPMSVLQWAISQGHHHLLRHALQYDSCLDINLVTGAGTTALHAAIMKADLYSTHALLRKGADLTIQCIDGETPVEAALMEWLVDKNTMGLKEIRKQILWAVLETIKDRNFKTAFGVPLLHLAVLCADFSLIITLLSPRAVPALDPNVCDRNGWNALTVSVFAQHGHSEISRLLIQYGVDPEMPDNNGRKACWHVENSTDHPAMVNMLLGVYDERCLEGV